MKNWLFGILMLSILSSLGACSRHNGCKGGGWYGNRNLGFETKVSPQQSQDCLVNEDEIVAEEQTAMPSR